MSRHFAQFLSQFWTGETGKAIRQLGPECQVVSVYLFTCPSASALGLYYLPIPTLSHETGISPKGALKALRSLSEVGFCLYDAPSEWIFVPNMARFQIADRLEARDNRVKWIRRELEALVKAPFFNDFLNLYRDAFHLHDISPSEAPSEAHRSQETETEKETESKNTRSQARSSLSSQPSRKKPEREFPEDFVLDQTGRDFYAKHISAADAAVEFERFKAHHQAKGTTHCDWPAAWRKWVLNQEKWAGERNGNGNGRKATAPISAEEYVRQTT